MKQLTQQDIPGFGTVTLGPVSVGMVRQALEVAAQAEENNQPDVFTNLVLAGMLVEPAKTPEEVASLPNDIVTALVEIAADNLGVHKEFNDTSTDLPARERLYQTYLEHERAFFAEWATLVEKSFKGSLDQIYGQVGKALAQAIVPADMVERINESFRHMAALNLKLSSPPVEVFLLGEQRQQEMQEAIGRFVAEPLQKLVAGLGRIKLPEPFLSDALLASGLNSPLLHSPTYSLPEIELPRTVEEIETRAEDKRHRRLVDAYDILIHLEQSLRELIETKLREMHGNHWWKRGVPEAVREGCEERKQAKEKPFEVSHHPIYYAYVDDYKTIIVKRDNWAAVFAAIFGNKTELEASFAWVGNARDAIAHARPLSDDDYLWFTAGAHWLQVAIARAKEARG